MSMSVTTTKDTHGVFHSAVTVDVPSLTFTISKPSVIQCELSARAVSYTHLTLPTTPYV